MATQNTSAVPAGEVPAQVTAPRPQASGRNLPVADEPVILAQRGTEAGPLMPTEAAEAADPKAAPEQPAPPVPARDAGDNGSADSPSAVRSRKSPLKPAMTAGFFVPAA
ncbi:MAG: hypothetical protein Q4F72_12345 [Desulfovibrionaceae bacterium]|nr:hypothetical protein [Desulfovibrionaceae bacterium]